jgi:hypothetical protein
MRDNKAISAIASVVLLGSSLAIGLCFAGGFGPRIDSAPYREAGRTLARQTLALLKPGGSITVITRDTAAFENPASDILLASFRKELARSGAKVDSLQALQIDPLRPAEVPAGDFFQWIKTTAKGNVLVSFMGPPILNETQLAQLGEVKPAIVALCSGSMRDRVELRSLFSKGLLHAAVISKRPVPIKIDHSLSDREAFDRLFVEATAENLSALSASSASTH